MANHKSAEKRHRQSLKKKLRNKTAKTSARTAIKKAKVALTEKKTDAKQLARSAESSLAKLVVKGIMHKKTASRLISRLNKKSKK